jgi:hypothetical protein
MKSSVVSSAKRTAKVAHLSKKSSKADAIRLVLAKKSKAEKFDWKKATEERNKQHTHEWDKSHPQIPARHANPFTLDKKQLQRNKLYFVSFSGNVPKDMPVGMMLEDIKTTVLGKFGSETVMLQVRPKMAVTNIMVSGNAMVRPNSTVKFVPKEEKKVTMPSPVKHPKEKMEVRVFFDDKFWNGVIKEVKGTKAVVSFKAYPDETWPLSKVYPR